ncbi:cytochrome P450 [Dichomitus squalens LYAD-421 SS1]|uniref:Cytochrome P450 n=1 Tax=Dichomitus squalens (strain LYAD-421) TaxID=732165 RepID=R7T177_DICSQ|nr:cytochrome P450 [Dichomitus squalens LYAD-421 SS1]EJF62111.1 cytochrome P450 [Dichomitus squalens LYAD-421 SS1]
MDQGQPWAFICVGVLIVLVVFRWNISPLNDIPTVGNFSTPALSYLSAMAFIRRGKETLQEGYRLYYGSVFKIALLDRWMVIFSGPKMVEDIRRRPEDELSFTEAVQTILQYKYTVGQKMQDDPYHTVVVKEKLQNRLLPFILPSLIDEVAPAVEKYLPTTNEEWTTVDISAAALKIVARTSNRVFVGSPLCDEEYNDTSAQFAIEIVKAGTALFLFPDLLKPLAAPFVSKVKRTTKRALHHLRPIIQERRTAMHQQGKEWLDKPNDVLQWIIDRAVVKDETDADITERLLLLNLAAIHTSSSSVPHVLYHLAEQPELLEPLREEIEASVDAEGWTMSAYARMWKLDSILRESQRYNGFTLASMMRVAMKDIVLDNGTFIPKGTLLGAAAHPAHHDNAHLPNADLFDPFRFSRMREAGSSSGSSRLQFSSTSPEYLPFGHGQLACPGRYFAGNQLKAILSHIILNYDLKLSNSKDDGPRPQRPSNVYLSLAILPPIGGTIQFRKRAAV